MMTVILSSNILFLTSCAPIQVEVPQPAAPESAENAESETAVTDGASFLPVKEEIALNPDWDYAEMSEINSDAAVLYRATETEEIPRKDIVIAVNAGHGTAGGEEAQVYCHPDKSPKITDGTNPAGSLKAVAISMGMIFADGATEAEVALQTAQILRDKLLEKGYDVLMIRDEDDVQLDNVARTVIANNKADCLVSLHWDGDGRSYDKGCFFIHVPEEIYELDPVSSWHEEHERLGEELIKALEEGGEKIYRGRNDPLELTQTCYATIPAVVVELGNAASAHKDKDLERLADGLLAGIERFIESRSP